MNRKGAKEIIKAIAKKEGKDERMIREEMKEAINTGYMNAGKQEMMYLEPDIYLILKNLLCG